MVTLSDHYWGQIVKKYKNLSLLRLYNLKILVLSFPWGLTPSLPWSDRGVCLRLCVLALALSNPSISGARVRGFAARKLVRFHWVVSWCFMVWSNCSGKVWRVKRILYSTPSLWPVTCYLPCLEYYSSLLLPGLLIGRVEDISSPVVRLGQMTCFSSGLWVDLSRKFACNCVVALLFLFLASFMREECMSDKGCPAATIL